MKGNAVDSEFDEIVHEKLLKDLRKIDGEEHKIGKSKVVRFSSEGSTTSHLNNVLNKIGQNTLTDKTKKENKTLATPLEKPVSRRIRRAAGYESVVVDVNKWEGVVKKNRSADQLSFPLDKPDVSVITTLRNTKPSIKTKLEKDVYSLLNGADLMEKKEETPEEKQRQRAMSLQEIKMKSREMWRERQLKQRLERKAALLNKSKSRNYHRILKRDRLRQMKREFEQLKHTDPEKALDILTDIEKSRVQERMSLRHRKSKWLQAQGIKAGRDKKFRDTLQDNVEVRSDLLEKLKMPQDITDETQDSEDDLEQILKEQKAAIAGGKFDAHNAWVSQLALPEEQEKVDGGFLKMKRYWEDIHQRKITEKEAMEVVEKLEAKKKEEEAEELNGNEDNEVFNKKKLNLKMKPKKLNKSQSEEPSVDDDFIVVSSKKKKVKCSVKTSSDLKKPSLTSQPVNSDVEEECTEMPFVSESLSSTTKRKCKEKGSAKGKSKSQKKAGSKIPKQSKNVKVQVHESEPKKKSSDGTTVKNKKVKQKKDTLSKSISGKGKNIINNSEIIQNQILDELKIDSLFDKATELIKGKVMSAVTDPKEQTPKLVKVTGKNKNTSSTKSYKTTSIEMEFGFAGQNNPEMEETTTRLQTIEDIDDYSKTEGRDSLKGSVDKIIKNNNNNDSNGSKLNPNNVNEKQNSSKTSDVKKIVSRKLGNTRPDLFFLKRLRESDEEDADHDSDDDLKDLFDDEENIKAFRTEKTLQEEKQKPEDISTFKQGWGSWAGPGIVISERKKRKFRIKAPVAPPNKFSTVGNVIYNESADVHANIRKAMVSEIPHPFLSVADFEASIRQSLGRNFVPEAEHRKLTAPPIITKAGTVIPPMGEDALLKNYEENKKQTKLEEKMNKALYEKRTKNASGFLKKNNKRKGSSSTLHSAKITSRNRKIKKKNPSNTSARSLNSFVIHK